MLRKIFNTKAIFGFIFFTMVISTIYVIVRIIVAPVVADPGEIGVRVKGDYIEMLLQCIGGILVLLLPSFIIKRFKIEIPSFMITIFAIFLYLAIYLGDVRFFFYRVPYWDNILHAFSGIMLGALGFSLINFLNKNNRIIVVLSPSFVAIFAFCFAITIGVFWEIYEFTIDYFFNTNMLQFKLEDGTEFVGLAAITDTIMDLIIDAVGAFIMSLIGYISLKHKKGWLDRFQIQRSENR